MPSQRQPASRTAPAAKRAAAAPRAKKADATVHGQAAEAGALAATELRILKKYPNRRLYDTRSSSYITLADVKQMVLRGEEFEVLDAKTSDNLTRSILLQIILEEESGGVPMFTTPALAQIIRFYGHTMQGLMGTMLEKNLQAFAKMQAQMLDPLSTAKGITDAKQLPPELWTQFLSGQPAALQGLMDSYVAQSSQLLEQMQEANKLFPGIAGFAGKR